MNAYKVPARFATRRSRADPGAPAARGAGRGRVHPGRRADRFAAVLITGAEDAPRRLGGMGTPLCSGGRAAGGATAVAARPVTAAEQPAEGLTPRKPTSPR
jgi:hypothetical protein